MIKSILKWLKFLRSPKEIEQEKGFTDLSFEEEKIQYFKTLQTSYDEICHILESIISKLNDLFNELCVCLQENNDKNKIEKIVDEFKSLQINFQKRLIQKNAYDKILGEIDSLKCFLKVNPEIPEFIIEKFKNQAT